MRCSGILIDTSIKSYAPFLLQNLILAGCEVVVDNKINRLFKNKLKLAKEIDWKTEYLKPKISVKSVNGVEEAVSHILLMELCRLTQL